MTSDIEPIINSWKMNLVRMDYSFEKLDPERFQQFCQALLLRSFPNLQCLPVGQPDGGRDAILKEQLIGRRSTVVFQVKFVRSIEPLPEPRKWLIDIMRAELPKIQRLAQRGARRYVLLTNVPGTSHPDVGSIDLLQSLLAEIPNIDAQCWWRDDLNRRLEAEPNIKWAYPELLSGLDLMQLLVEHNLSEDQQRRTHAVRAAMATEYGDDSEVRFKQIELHTKMLDIFIDIPCSLGPSSRRTRFGSPPLLGRRLTQSRSVGPRNVSRLPDLLLDRPHSRLREGPPNWLEIRAPRSTSGLTAATFLLTPRTAQERPLTVLEGAPGQGKSTIVQYVCQVHRMRLLGHEADLDKVAAHHRTGPVRIPFKVDLSEFAAWIGAPTHCRTAPTPAGDPWRSLEGLIAAQIESHSGGVPFSVADLHAVCQVSAVILVLDGLDEVADIDVRKAVVAEIIRTVGRLRAIALSIQVVVTSRPAAFANSPGLPEDEFAHCELLPITPDLIMDFTARWIQTRVHEKPDEAEIRRVLRERLDQPHIRDLARHPMQLAILLSLIHARGASLPDKRTALYDNYLSVFFDREAGKSSVVRQHRDMLINLHRYLGWVLHAEAETSQTRGRVTGKRLHTIIEEFLELEELDVSLSDSLFDAVVERLHAIVSKTEGIYEFEVQPMREYFAARHLYETAQYSPPGRERPGTLPDRFDALARNPYWLNVVRFYAGCFSRGEFECLVGQLSAFRDDPVFRYTAHPYLLAAMLLEDWIFAQSPHSTQAVVRLLLSALGIRTGKGDRSSVLAPSVTLARECGASDVVTHCLALLSSELPDEYAQQIIELLRANSDTEAVAVAWFAAASASKEASRTQWFRYGRWLGVFDQRDETQLDLLMGDEPVNPHRLASIASGGWTQYVESSDDRLAAVVLGILAGDVTVDVDVESDLSLIGAFALAHDPRTYTSGLFPLIAVKASEAVGVARSAHGRAESKTAYKCAALMRQFLGRSLAMEGQALAKRVGLLSDFVEASRAEWGDQWAHIQLAAATAALRVGRVSSEVRRSGLFATDLSLCSRARLGREQAEQPEWWSDQLEGASSPTEMAFCVTLLLCWADVLTISILEDTVERTIGTFDSKVFDRVVESIALCRGFGRSRPTKVRDLSDLTLLPPMLSSRLATALSVRVARGIFDNYFDRYKSNDWAHETDKSVLAFQVQGELGRVRLSPDRWEQALRVVALWYAQSPGITGHSLRVLSANKLDSAHLPLTLAKFIVSRAGSFPLDLVLAAEAQCRSSASHSIRSVWSVAEVDGWFQ